MILRKVEQSIRDRRLIGPGDRVLVGVSGGLDSVVLLHVLHALSNRHAWSLAVFHLDHRLRGLDAQLDADFVEETGWRLGLPVYRFQCDIREHARMHGLSVEMAARKVRRKLAAEVCDRIGAASVAWGHHADDQVETVVLRLARGTSPEGLAGMAAREVFPGLVVIRPLLDLTRSALEAFACTHRLTWRQDASNQSDDFARNRARRHVLPVLESQLNPMAREAILRMSRLARDERDLLAARTAELLAACGAAGSRDDLRRDRLQALHIADLRRVLRAWLLDRGVDPILMTFARLDRLTGLVPGRSSGEAPLAGGISVIARGNRIAVKAAPAPPPPPTVLVPPCRMELPDWGLRVRLAWGHGFEVHPEPAPGRLPCAAELDALAVAGRPILLRSWKPGDRYRPLGMKGSVKLQDLFVNARTPRELRDRIPVLQIGRSIAWVAGARIGEAFRVPGPDAPSLRIRIEPLEEGG